MTYSVHQHWDPLKVCAVGISYPPEFYSFVKNNKVRSVLEKIAEETEEDYQSLIKLLHNFGVETVRPELNNDPDYYKMNGRYLAPNGIMCPRDTTAMVGDTFYMPSPKREDTWNDIKGPDWPERPNDNMSESIKREIKEIHNVDVILETDFVSYKPIEELIKKQGNKIVYDQKINTATMTRIGKDLYFGTEETEGERTDQEILLLKQKAQSVFPNYRHHILKTAGHSDGIYCPVKPGLIVSLTDLKDYEETFPDWEVVYLEHQGWSKMKGFLDVKEKNKGKWWVPGEELNDDFTNFVESWLGHWVGYAEETVFDVNMLVIDEKNVIVNNENDQVFEAFERYGITPHVCNFRHRYFWDGGLHCITSDLHREGQQQDYFPERS